jgi:hypothetical protein
VVVRLTASVSDQIEAALRETVRPASHCETGAKAWGLWLYGRMWRTSGARDGWHLLDPLFVKAGSACPDLDADQLIA